MSEINPADVTVGSTRLITETLADDIPETDVPAPRREREGLPAGYRMRADAHYVDALTARSDRTLAEAARQPRRTDAEPDAHHESRERRDARDWRADRVFAQLREDLATIESSALVLASGTTSVAQRTSVDLVRSHAWRASWLVRAGALLDGGTRGRIRPRPIGAVLASLRDGFAPECRLSGLSLHVHTPDWNASVAIDEQDLATGLAGAVIATLGLVGQVEGATIKVLVATHGGELRTIEVSQEEETVPGAVVARMFDPMFSDRPGGWVAGLGAWTARAVAQRHGGDATFAVGDRFGSTLRMSFVRAS